MSNLKCTKCKSNRIKIIETRSTEDTVYRLRQCKKCKKRVCTVEIYRSDENSLYGIMYSRDTQGRNKKIEESQTKWIDIKGKLKDKDK